ncbi:hypothetical protein [Haloterrigena sp. H1]|uniref:hypothetical protein n=1 Tax=Haloterrigena sp. H1 TaxID=2552943 RepID=UPI001485E201|nr:hypothetical protein [Haloterrigena sp. H1]
MPRSRDEPREVVACLGRPFRLARGGLDRGPNRVDRIRNIVTAGDFLPTLLAHR